MPHRYNPGIGLRPGGEGPDLEPLIVRFYAAMYESIAAHSRLGLNVVVDVGHHRLTMRLLEAGLLSEKARIVTSGSEAARGDVPMMNPIELPKLAAEHFANDPIAAVAIQRFDPPLQYSPTTAYSMAKVLVAYWTATLARRLPAGMTVNAVSPGNTLTTGAPRNAGFMMRRIMLPLMKILPGMSDTVAVAAKRYLDAAQFADDQSGDFYASPPKKMIDRMEKVVVPHVLDEAG